MLSLLVLAAAPVAFQGGSPSELAKSIAEATKSSVVIEASPFDSIKAFNYDVSNLNQMANTIHKEAGLKQAPGQEYAYYRPTLPAWLFEIGSLKRLIGNTPRGGRVTQVTPGMNHEGNVTLHHSPRSGFEVSVLANSKYAKFAKPVEVAIFFDQFNFSAWVTDMPERKFLQIVCKAIGGKLRTSKETYYLEPAGQELQRRALATFDQAKKEPGYPKLTAMERAELELSRSAVSSATATQLEQLYAEKSKPIKMEIGPGARAVVLQLLRAMMEVPQETQSFGPPQDVTGAAPKPEDRFRGLDRRIIGTVILQRGFQAYAELATVDQLGRPGPLMRVP